MRLELWQVVVFAVVSAVLVYVSRASLRAPRSHGFSRFFAWECILGLFVLDARVWFRDPLAWNQLVAWTLLAACLVPLVLGVRGLVTRGRPARARAGEPELLAFEKTTALVTTGVYRYIRHPLYSSLLLLAWGIFFKRPGWRGAALAAAATALLYVTARADERECVAFFGPPYEAYMRTTRRFVPFLF